MKQAIVVIYRDFGPVYRLNLKAMARAAREQNATAFVITLDGTEISDIEADAHFKVSNFSDFSLTLTILDELAKDFQIKSVLPAYEEDVGLALQAMEHLGVRENMQALSEFVRNKNVMQAKAKEIGVPIAQSYIPSTLSVEEFNQSGLHFPVIVKPYDGMGSRSTYKVHNETELQDLALSNEILKQYRVEEFIEGEQFHVDSVIQNGEVIFKSVSEYSTTPLKSLQDPTTLFASQIIFDESVPHIKEMIRLNEIIIREFGFVNGVAHVEFFLTPDKRVYFGEIGARLPGVYVSNLIKEGYQIKMAEEWVRAELVEKHVVQYQARPYVGAALLKSVCTGRIDELGDEQKIIEDKQVLYHQIWKQVGQEFEKASMSCDAFGFVVVKCDSHEEVFPKLQQINLRYQSESKFSNGN
ncbi:MULTISPECIES: ATP-grasp domain-containing protein [Pseudoalteromonas]|uniref:ATP-grasp domain-containing protein n=1 Tax=Pseudoalteromonas amylolytica TaxID=1859457 RepID=A0A1S1MTC7_9GAMM|nr:MULTISPECIES: ATP-grasp domain-containing protein [Pseudoalteromonas]OHU86156.1 hypothetical protein BFC16_15715 [Pseudoalteromonas sp. JW3]OHU89737.1 hypothetical protein BET10_16600 [Pseudoalteromonas amylolytica]